MALTAEESRALQYNLQTGRRALACRTREFTLRGSDSAKKSLTDRMQAIQGEESNEQQQKIRYDDRIDRFGCEGGTVNG